MYKFVYAWPGLHPGATRTVAPHIVFVFMCSAWLLAVQNNVFGRMDG